jgi:hypothetical protein
MISGFESRSAAFPKYDDYTVFRSANVQHREHFMQKKEDLNTIVWETNLRRTPEENKKLLGSTRKSQRSNASNYR